MVQPTKASAIVGGAPVSTDSAARAVVSIVGTRGSFCSGALISPRIVLTAAHCVQRGGTYKVVLSSAEPLRSTMIDVARVIAHPRFSLQDMANHRAGADLALLQLSDSVDRPPLGIARPMSPILPGRLFRIIGGGLTSANGGTPSSVMRSATLAVTGTPGALQIRLVDPLSGNTRAGLGACDGDSGGPVVENQNDRAVTVGVVAWSTGPANMAGCGGLTGVTPLTLYRDWILQTARSWGTRLD